MFANRLNRVVVGVVRKGSLLQRDGAFECLSCLVVALGVCGLAKGLLELPEVNGQEFGGFTIWSGLVYSPP